jgi:hypothetical protein
MVVVNILDPLYLHPLIKLVVVEDAVVLENNRVVNVDVSVVVNLEEEDN